MSASAALRRALIEIGRGRSKTVFADAIDPERVVVEMAPNPVTEAFLRWARTQHAQGLPAARHLPNPSEMERAGALLRFSADKLEPNDTRARIGRENGEFFLTGLADDDPQRAPLLETMRSLDEHLKETLPPGSPNYFYDMGPQNFMRRKDGTFVINDPVEIRQLLLMLGGGGAAGMTLREALANRARAA